MKEILHIHMGENVRRFREFLGWKQKLLAFKMGQGWTQEKVSRLEHREYIPEDLTKKISVIFGISAEILEKCTEEDVILIMREHFADTAKPGE